MHIICLGPADDTSTQLSLASLKFRIVQPFWYPLIQVVLGKKPINVCSFIALLYIVACVYISSLMSDISVLHDIMPEMIMMLS